MEILKTKDITKENKLKFFEGWVFKVEERIQESMKKKTKGKVAVAMKEWTPEEMVLLSSGMKRFPAGLPNRWKQISQIIGTRSIKEV